MTLIRPVVSGTNGDDTLSAGGGEATFALGGNDTIETLPGTEYNFQLGGSGNDVYRLANNAAVTILDSGGTDTIVALGIGVTKTTTYAATYRDALIVADLESGQQVAVVNWTAAENRIETVHLADGQFSYQQVANLLPSAPGYLGEASLQDLLWLDCTGVSPISGRMPCTS